MFFYDHMGAAVHFRQLPQIEFLNVSYYQNYLCLFNVICGVVATINVSVLSFVHLVTQFLVSNFLYDYYIKVLFYNSIQIMDENINSISFLYSKISKGVQYRRPSPINIFACSVLQNV